MNKTKKLVISLIVAVVAVVAILAVREYYLYTHPNFDVRYHDPGSGDDRYVYPTLALSARSRFGYAPKFDEYMYSISSAYKTITKGIGEEYVKPMNVTTSISVEDGQTVLRREGYATNLAGEKVDMDMEIRLDFVISKKLPSPQ